MKHLIPVVLFCVVGSSIAAVAQRSTPGSWRDLSSFSIVNHVSYDELNNRIYAAGTLALFYQDLNDNSLNKITRINGLSDVGITAMRVVPQTGEVIVAYATGNLDIITAQGVENYPDIALSSVPGEKAITRIKYLGNQALLCSGVGLVVFDLERREVSSTWRAAPPGSGMIYNDVTVFNDTLFAATNTGIFRSPLSNPFPEDFSTWVGPEPIEGAEGLPCNRILATSQGIWASFLGPSGNRLTRYLNSAWQPSYGNCCLEDMITDGTMLYHVFRERIDQYSTDLSFQGSITAPSDFFFTSGEIDPAGGFWLGSRGTGMVHLSQNGQLEFIAPEGPHTSSAFDMELSGNELLVATGMVQFPGTWNNAFSTTGWYKRDAEGRYTEYSWNSEPFLEESGMRDVVSVAFDPNDPNRYWAGTHFNGLYEVVNNEIVNRYDFNNSALQERQNLAGWCGASSLDFDSDGNLWISNPFTAELLVARTADGEWLSFNMSPALPPVASVTRLTVTSTNQIWLIQNNNGVAVFQREEGPVTESIPYETTLLTSASGSGGLPSSSVNSVTEDLDGEIWVGTNQGIAVFYTPTDLFTDNPSDAELIIVEQDGFFQYLLESENVLSIAVDGANQKWVGTASSGVYLLSEDGREQLANFNVDNSPLPSNTVLDIAVNPQTGEVFMATNQGIFSYQSTATEGVAPMQCNTVFPNPLRPQDDGPIVVGGLNRGADVRITDLRGQLVAELQSAGGQATWDALGTDGQRVPSGVYFAVVTNADGTDGCTTKFAVVR